MSDSRNVVRLGVRSVPDVASQIKCRQAAVFDKTKVNAIASHNINVFTVQFNWLQLEDNRVVTLKLSSTANNYICFQIDSGADCNVLPLHVYQPATGHQELQF